MTGASFAETDNGEAIDVSSSITKSSNGLKTLYGGYDDKMSTIEERWTPASTARREPLSHFVAVERIRNAVVLDSIGPPPEP